MCEHTNHIRAVSGLSYADDVHPRGPPQRRRRALLHPRDALLGHLRDRARRQVRGRQPAAQGRPAAGRRRRWPAQKVAACGSSSSALRARHRLRRLRPRGRARGHARFAQAGDAERERRRSAADPPPGSSSGRRGGRGAARRAERRGARGVDGDAAAVHHAVHQPGRRLRRLALDGLDADGRARVQSLLAPAERGLLRRRRADGRRRLQLRLLRAARGEAGLPRARVGAGARLPRVHRARRAAQQRLAPRARALGRRLRRGGRDGRDGGADQGDLGHRVGLDGVGEARPQRRASNQVAAVHGQGADGDARRRRCAADAAPIPRLADQSRCLLARRSREGCSPPGCRCCLLPRPNLQLSRSAHMAAPPTRAHVFATASDAGTQRAQSPSARAS